MSIRSKPIPRSFWYSVGIAVLFNSLFLAQLLLKPGTPRQFVITDDVGQALGWLLATLFCWVSSANSLDRLFIPTTTLEYGLHFHRGLMLAT
jgi:hypothetical protein